MQSPVKYCFVETVEVPKDGRIGNLRPIVEDGILYNPQKSTSAALSRLRLCLCLHIPPRLEGYHSLCIYVLPFTPSLLRVSIKFQGGETNSLVVDYYIFNSRNKSFNS